MQQKRILVLGGTRFFGKTLVHRLISANHAVTVASRNFSKVDFDSSIRRITVEREDAHALGEALAGLEFDLVYDQIGYSPTASRALLAALGSRVGRIVFTSTQSVYPHGGLQREADFDPLTYPRRLGLRAEFEYGEGKRLAEAEMFGHAHVPVCAVRFPFVLGDEDYTRRLEFHVEHVVRGQAFAVPNLGARLSLIFADEAAEFLEWAGHSGHTGPINACSSGEVTLGGILELIESRVGRKALLDPSAEPSPYGMDESHFMDTTRATELGFRFRRVGDWLPGLVERVAAQTKG